MKSVLCLSDSVENTKYDFQRSVRTIKAYDMDPTSIVPVFYDSEGNTASMDIDESMEFALGECSVSAISIGYLTSESAVNSIAAKLEKYLHPEVVYSPVIISDTGDIMIDEDTFFAIKEKLLPKTDLLIINRLEAELLADFTCAIQGDYLRACKKLFNVYNCKVLIRAAKDTEDADVYFDGKRVTWFEHLTYADGFDATTYNLPTTIACIYAKTGEFDVAAARDVYSGKTKIKSESSIIDFGGITLPEVEKKPEPEAVIEEPVLEEPVHEAVATKQEEIVLEPVVQVKEEVVPEPVVEPKVEAPKVSTQESLGILASRLASMRDSKPSVTSTTSLSTSSLVSPAKSLRDRARSFEQAYSAPQSKGAEAPAQAVTSSISVTPIQQKKSTLEDIQAMRERLQKLAAGPKKEEEEKKKDENAANE